jgi:hypothetical protein
VDLTKGFLRFAPGPSFRLSGVFEPGTGGALEAGVPFSYRVRGLEESFGAGVLREGRGGRLRYRAPRGVDGLRLLVLDPFRERLVLKGKGLDIQKDDNPRDPTVEVDLDVDGVRFAAIEEGLLSLDGNAIRIAKP